MKGSEKQVRWAEKIKAELLEELDKQINDDRFSDIERIQKVRQEARELKQKLENIDSAQWWIDNREATFSAFTTRKWESRPIFPDGTVFETFRDRERG